MKLFGQIRYFPPARERTERVWDDLVSRAFDLSTISKELAIAILKKFMWQVKLKILNRNITNHLMVIFVGPQGTGKSTFVRDRLCGPVHEIMKGTDFVGVCDDKNLELFEYYVLFLDEMDKANRVDSGTIRRRITEKSISTRLHHSHSQGQQDNHATFIGTSNLPVDQVIVDTTGARRFFQLDMLVAAKQHWDFFNAIDWCELWQSVNENGDDPTASVFNEITDIQDAARARSVVEDWARWVSEHHPQQIGEAVLCKALFYEDEDGAYEDKRVAVPWCFDAYQQRYAPGARLSESYFGKELTRLCLSYGVNFPLRKREKRSSSGWKYEWQIPVV